VRTAFLIAAVLLVGSSALAGPIEDANAGLAALQGGDNDGAIALFTRALDSGRLHGEDQEFAYAARGQAYLNKADLSRAIADLDRARQMKPDDKDAQAALATAICKAQPAATIRGAPVGGAIFRGLLNNSLTGQPVDLTHCAA
jgi:tetratricopeptide (TPR) repeat protein